MDKALPASPRSRVPAHLINQRALPSPPITVTEEDSVVENDAAACSGSYLDESDTAAAQRRWQDECGVVKICASTAQNSDPAFDMLVIVSLMT